MTIGNKATSNIQRVLVGDYGTMITITLDNVEDDKVATIEWIRAFVNRGLTAGVRIEAT